MNHLTGRGRSTVAMYIAIATYLMFGINFICNCKDADL